MSETNIKVGFGFAKGRDSFAVGLEAARRAAAGIMEYPASVVLVFASVRYDLEKVLKGIQYTTRGAPILGTTTAGEVCNGAQKESVVVLVLASPFLKVAVGVGEKVSLDWEEAVMQAVNTGELMPYFASDIAAVQNRLTLEGKQAFGLLFSPGNTRCCDSRSFEILEKLKQLSENRLPIFGGSSADDWHMETNFVLHDGRAYPDGLLLAVFETSLQFGMAFYHGFVPGPDRAAITKAEGHEVLELNGQPAAEVFGRFLGKPVKALEGKHLTLTSARPIGVPDPYGQYSIKVASYLTSGNGIRLSQPVSQGSTLILMQSEPENLVSAGKEAFCKSLLRGSVENPAAAIVFSCAVRQKLLGERIDEEISNIMQMAPGVPVTGFYSFGEQGLADDGVNRHNNGVITTLVIGSDLSYAARVASENNVLRHQLEQTVSNLNNQEEIVWKAEKKYRAIFENAREGIYQSTPEGRYLSANPAMARIYGYASPEEMIQAVESIGREIFVIPEKWEELRQLLATHSETGDFEVEQRRKDGSPFWASLRIHAVYGEDGRVLYWEGRCIEITKRKQAEDELRRTSALLDMIVDSIPNMIFLKDARELRFVRFNQAGEDLLGYSREDLLGKSDYDFFTREQADFFTEKDREALCGRRVVDIPEEPLLTADKGTRILHTMKVPLFDANGEPEYLLGISEDITERKRAEMELLREKLFTEKLLESLPGIFFLYDSTCHLKRWNKAHETATGFSADELRDWYIPDWHETPEDAAVGMALVKSVLETGVGGAFETTLVNKEGRFVPYLISITRLLVPDGPAMMMGVGIDITERKQAEELYRTLTDSLQSGVFIVQDKKLQFVNPHIPAYSGYSENELIGRDTFNFVHPEDHALLRLNAIDMLKGKRTNPYEYRIIDRKGNIKWLMETVRSITYKGKLAVLGNTMDVTERYQMESLFRQTQKMEAVGTLAGGIAHDFNNILAAIIGYTELVKGKLQQRELHHYLEQVLRASERAKNLVTQILAFSRKADKEIKPVDISSLTTEALRLLRATIPSTIEIRQEITQEVCEVLADPIQLHQVIMNLCTNAAHAMRERGGVLEVSLSKAEITPEMLPLYPDLNPGPYVKLRVNDTGTGIRPDVMGKIFDPFFTTKKVGEGTGLGLSVVYGIVKECGGAVAVQSELGKGSKFSIYLPAIEHGAELTGEPASTIPGGKERVIFVDDENILAEMGREMLEGLGYEVIAATSSASVLEIFRAQPDRFDLVITDMTMPGMTGKELATELLGIRSDIPIILCTGYSEIISEDEAKSMGVREFATKPLNLRSMAELVRKALDKKES